MVERMLRGGWIAWASVGALCATAAQADVYRDLDGDGRSDILLRDRVPIGTPPVGVPWRVLHADGTVVNGAPFLSSEAHIVGYGNFDGVPATSEVLVQAGDAGDLIATRPALDWVRPFAPIAPAFVEVVAVGDFDGDPGGLADVIVRDELTSATWIYLTADAAPGATVTPVDLGLAMWLTLVVAGVADFDGDGRDDLLLRHQTGQESSFRIWYMDGTDVSIRYKDVDLLGPYQPFDQFGMQAGDFDGDGLGDLILRDARGTGTTGHTTLLRHPDWPSLAAGSPPSHDDVASVDPGLWHVRAGGDRDGDGTTDLFGVLGPLEEGWLYGLTMAGPVGTGFLLGPPAAPYLTGDAVWHRERPTTVKRFKTISNYRRSGDRIHSEPGGDPRWSPQEIVDLLQAYSPEWHVDTGIWTGRPVGHEHHEEVGTIVEAAHGLIDGLSIPAEEKQALKGRFVFHYRADVFAKRVEGDPTCDPDCGWGGTMTTPAFDPAWIVTVSKAEHRWAIDGLWGGDPQADPLCGTALYQEGVDQCPLNPDIWPSWMDREAIQAVTGPDAAPALYGGVGGDGTPADPYRPSISGVVLDLRDADYRAWSAQRLVANLAVWGIDPGEPAVVLVATKPGFHTHFAGALGGGPHPVPDAHTWTGPSHPAGGHGAATLVRSDYGPGEYEVAMNLLLQDLRAAVEAAGYPDVVFATVERPEYVRKWRDLHPSIRRAPWMRGEHVRSCNETAYPDPPEDPLHEECPTLVYPGSGS